MHTTRKMPKNNHHKILYINSIPMLLCVPKCWMLTEEQMGGIKTEEMCFIRVIIGYRMANHKHKQTLTE